MAIFNSYVSIPEGREFRGKKTPHVHTHPLSVSIYIYVCVCAGWGHDLLVAFLNMFDVVNETTDSHCPSTLRQTHVEDLDYNCKIKI